MCVTEKKSFSQWFWLWQVSSSQKARGEYLPWLLWADRIRRLPDWNMDWRVPCNLIILDTSGNNEEKNVSSLTYKAGNALVICFNLTDKISFANIKNFWLPLPKRAHLHHRAARGTPCARKLQLCLRLLHAIRKRAPWNHPENRHSGLHWMLSAVEWRWGGGVLPSCNWNLLPEEE